MPWDTVPSIPGNLGPDPTNIPLMPAREQQFFTPEGEPVDPNAPATPAPEPSYTDVILSAWNVNNPWFGSDPQTFHDPDFSLRDALANAGPRYQAAPEAFVGVHSQQDFDNIKSRIDLRDYDNKQLDASGYVPFFAGQVVSLLGDPTVMIPGGAIVKSVRGGASVARSAGSAAAYGAVAGTTSEGLRKASDPMISEEEMIANIGLTTVFSSVLGAGAAKFLNRRMRKELGERWRQEELMLRSASEDAVPVTRFDPDTFTPEESEIAGRIPSALGRVGATLRLSPALRLLKSREPKTRETGDQLLETSVQLRGHTIGKSLGTSTEATVRTRTSTALYDVWNAQDEAHLAARQAGRTYTKQEFDILVGRALSRGDVGPDEFVTRAAQAHRKHIYAPALKEGQAVNLFPDTTKLRGDLSYFTRAWRIDALLARQEEAIEMFTEWAKQTMRKSEADARQIAEDIVANLTGRARDPIPMHLVPGLKGQFKGRALTISRDFEYRGVRAEDFMETSAKAQAIKYMQSTFTDIENTRRFGDPMLAGRMDEIREAYRQRRAAAKTDKERDRLARAEKNDLEVLAAARDALRGIAHSKARASGWGTMLRTLKGMALVSKLGGVTATSLVDAARLIGANGALRVGVQLAPQVAMLMQSQVSKLAKAESRRMGLVMEGVEAQRAMRTWGVEQVEPTTRKIDNATRKGTSGFITITGLPWWTDRIQHMASLLAQDRLARVLRATEVSRHDRGWAAQLGLTAEARDAIAAQMNQHAEKMQGIWTPNTTAWTDPAAVRAFRDAISTDVRRTVIEPGVGDKPVATLHPVGSVLATFMNFLLASHQRILMSGLQGRPRWLAEQVVAGTVMGMGIAQLKLYERGKYEEAQKQRENPIQWAMAGFEYGGMGSIYWDFAARAGQMGFPSPETLAIALTDEEAIQKARWLNRSPIDIAAGPVGGMLGDYATMASQLANADLKKSGVNAFFRSFPGATLPGARTAVETQAKPWIYEWAERDD